MGAGCGRLLFRPHVPAGGFETVAESGHVDAVVVQREVRAESGDEVDVELRVAACRMEGERLREAVDVFLERVRRRLLCISAVESVFEQSVGAVHAPRLDVPVRNGCLAAFQSDDAAETADAQHASHVGATHFHLEDPVMVRVEPRGLHVHPQQHVGLVNGHSVSLLSMSSVATSMAVRRVAVPSWLRRSHIPCQSRTGVVRGSLPSGTISPRRSASFTC